MSEEELQQQNLRVIKVSGPVGQPPVAVRVHEPRPTVFPPVPRPAAGAEVATTLVRWGEPVPRDWILLALQARSTINVDLAAEECDTPVYVAAPKAV